MRDLKFYYHFASLLPGSSGSVSQREPPPRELQPQITLCPPAKLREAARGARLAYLSDHAIFSFFFFFFALANRRLFSVLGGLGAPVVICANLSYPPTRHFLAEMRALVFAPVDTASFGCPCNFRQILLHAGDLCCCCRCLHDSRFSLRLIRSLFSFFFLVPLSATCAV